MNAPLVLGIDPGASGGFAVVTRASGVFSVFDARAPMLFEGRTRPALNTPKMDEWLSDVRRFQVGVIEEVHAMPKQGVSSSFQFGRMYGAAESLMMAHCPRWEYVSPRRWKQDMGLTSDKRQSIDAATALFGLETAKLFWPRRKDEGVAEAALIAAWWIKTNA